MLQTTGNSFVQSEDRPTRVLCVSLLITIQCYFKYSYAYNPCVLLYKLPCLALPCLALPCPALPCLALSCLALPCKRKTINRDWVCQITPRLYSILILLCISLTILNIIFGCFGVPCMFHRYRISTFNDCMCRLVYLPTYLQTFFQSPRYLFIYQPTCLPDCLTVHLTFYLPAYTYSLRW